MKGLILALFASTSLFGQQSLRIEKGDIFQLTGETFLLDSLIMMDSSILLLDGGNSTNVLRANVISIGRQCTILGRGKNGENGPDGTDGDARSATINGKNGRQGLAGINLIINFSKLSIEGELVIDLSGGNGGNGGRGGSIQGSVNSNVFGIYGTQKISPEAPRSGPTGKGGDGGNGGKLTIGYPASLAQLVNERVKISYQGGAGGKPYTPIQAISPNYFTGEKNGVSGKEGSIEIILLKE